MPSLALHAVTTTATTTRNCFSWRCDRNRTRRFGGGRFFSNTGQTACLTYILPTPAALPFPPALLPHAKRRGKVGGEIDSRVGEENREGQRVVGHRSLFEQVGRTHPDGAPWFVPQLLGRSQMSLGHVLMRTVTVFSACDSPGSKRGLAHHPNDQGLLLWPSILWGKAIVMGDTIG